MTEPETHPGWDFVAGTLLHRFMRNWSIATIHDAEDAGGVVQQRADYVAADPGHPTGVTTLTLLLRELDEASGNTVLEEINAFYGFDGGPRYGTVVMFGPWYTPVPERHGWNYVGHPTLMLRPPGGAELPVPDGLRIEEVTDDAGLRAFEQVMARGFEVEEPEAMRPGAIFGSTYRAHAETRRWVGWADGEPVVGSEVCVAEGINDVTLVATDPKARRRGYAAVLTSIASVAAPELPAMLVATPAGRPVYERLGYLPLMPFNLWFQERPNPAAPAAG